MDEVYPPLVCNTYRLSSSRGESFRTETEGR